MRRIVVMGVSGCGKTTLGAALGGALGGRFRDGDDLHSPENRAKMGAGIPLTDADRWPWLGRVGEVLAEGPEASVVACSALKRAYRDRIREHAGGPVLFLHLAGPREVIAARMAARRDHYMPVSLLDSQFATLEVPGADELHATLDLREGPEALLVAALAAVRGA